MTTWNISFIRQADNPPCGRILITLVMALLLLLATHTKVHAESSATKVTPDIKTLARALQHDPDLIFEYVRNNIDYAPYFGSHKGATYTYLAGRGNDFDQSSLMIALLRESGYTAQYVYGAMSFDLQTMATLLGVEADPAIVFDQLEGGGIPVLSVNFSTGAIALRVVGVKLTINGADQLAFPWLKGHTTNAKIDLSAATGFDKSDFMNSATSGATVTVNSAQRLNETGIRTKLQQYTANLVSTLRNQHPNTELKNVLGQTTVIMGTPAYYSYSADPSIYVWEEIPTQITTPVFGQHKLIATLTINHNGISKTFELAEIAGKRLTISYTGASLTPELKLDGLLIATGSSTVANQTYACSISIDHPYLSMDFDWAAGIINYLDDNYLDQDNASNPYYLKSGANSVYAIVTDFGGVSDALLLRRQRVLAAAIAAGYGDTAESTLGESLNVVGLNYLQMISQTKQLTEGLVPKKIVQHHSIGLAAQHDTYYVSMDLNIDTSRNRTYEGATFDSFGLAKTSSTLFSAYEHAVLEQMETTGLEAVSTVKLLQLANATGETIFRADSSNFATIKPQLVNYSSTELNRLQDYVNQGFSLIIPRNGSLQLGDWVGHGYVVSRHTSGWSDVGMLIKNGLFGGYFAYQTYLAPNTVDLFQYYSSVVTPTTESIWNNVVNFYLPLSIDPVDMASGAFIHEHADLALGGGVPLGFSFGRSYTSNDNLQDNGLGYGWSHNLDIRLIKTSHAGPGLGNRTAVDAAPMIAAFQACLEVLTNTNDAANWTTAAIAAKWATDQLTDNAVVAQVGGKVMEFIKLPDGSYSPPPGITTQLVDNGNSTFSLKERFGTRLDFNTQNRVSQLKDADGNTMSFTYSGDKLSAVQDAFGRTLTLTYSGDRIASVADSTGRSISFAYDTGGNLTTYTDPAQKTWRYGYDPAKVCTDPAAPVPPEFREHRMTSLTDAQGVTTAVNTYDCTGRVDTQTVKRADAGGSLYDVTYNLYFSGYRNVEEDSAGNQTTYYYDRFGRPTSQVDALGQVTTKAYDGQNHVIRATDPRGNTTSYEYDGFNNLVKVVNANGETIHYRYDDPDVADDLPLLPITLTTDPLGNSVRHQYDAEFHRLWTKAYPAAGQEITTSATYYANGLVATATDGRGTVTTMVPDAYGTPNTVKTSTHPVVDLNYNARGQLASLIDQVGAQTSFVYDNRGLVTQKTDPLLQHVTYQYDNNGNLSQKTDRNSHTINYTYTPTNKLRTITYPNSSSVQFAYNSLDRLESMTDPLGTTGYTYDALGRPVSVTDPHGFTLSYGYDANGNITSITYPGNKTVSYTYDKLNRLTKVTNWLNKSATYSYDAAGRLVSFTNFNGIITSYGFNNASRLTSITSPVASYTFNNLDGNGNPGQVQADEPLAPAVPAGTISHTYNTPKNRLLAVGSENFTYDNEGQLATGYATDYSFDYEHRLVGIGAAVQYQYDGIGNRLAATRNGVTTRYVYDLNGNLIAEADASNTITRYYIHGFGLMAMVTPANTTYCYHFNQIGSTVAMTDMNKAMVNQYAYTPFGTIANQMETISQPFTFVGQMGVMAEPNGFYYMRARYYDPAVRRFISEDPIGFDGGDLNLYAYVGNNPTNYIDPSGNIMLIDDVLAWAGLKGAQYLVRGISYLAGKPLTSEQIQRMDNALMGTWKQTASATPFVVGGVVAETTGSVTAGMWANWGTETLIGLMAGEPSHEISLPPVNIPGTGYLLDVIDGIDILNPTPLGNGSFSYSSYGFPNIKPNLLK